MTHKKLEYKIKVDMSANPPVRLADEDGKVLDTDYCLVFNKDTDGIRKVDPYRIRFCIEDFKNSPLRFVPNKDDMFWAQEGTACPQSRCEIPGMMWVDDFDKKGEWIDVINMDLTELKFHFTLNFVRKDVANPTEADYIPLDPPGGNENGGGTGSGFTLSAYMTTGVVTGAVVGIGTAALVSYGFVAQNAWLYGIGGALVGIIVGLLFGRK